MSTEFYKLCFRNNYLLSQLKSRTRCAVQHQCGAPCASHGFVSERKGVPALGAWGGVSVCARAGRAKHPSGQGEIAEHVSHVHILIHTYTLACTHQKHAACMPCPTCVTYTVSPSQLTYCGACCGSVSTAPPTAGVWVSLAEPRAGGTLLTAMGGLADRAGAPCASLPLLTHRDPPQPPLPPPSRLMWSPSQPPLLPAPASYS